MQSHKQFLKWYEEFQNRKLDPKVFADETAPRRSAGEAEYISWYQKNRLHYYKNCGRMLDLLTLEKVKNWPNLPGLMTSVSPTLRSEAP